MISKEPENVRILVEGYESLPPCVDLPAVIGAVTGLLVQMRSLVLQRSPGTLTPPPAAQYLTPATSGRASFSATC